MDAVGTSDTTVTASTTETKATSKPAAHDTKTDAKVAKDNKAADQTTSDATQADQSELAQTDAPPAAADTTAAPATTDAAATPTEATSATPPDASATAVLASLIAPQIPDQTAAAAQDATATPAAPSVPVLPQTSAPAVKVADGKPPAKTDDKAAPAADMQFAKLLDKAQVDASTAARVDAPAKAATAISDATQTLQTAAADAPRTDASSGATSGFSLQPAAPADPSSTYSTATAAPAASNMSQAAIQNLSAMAVQIQHRLSAGNSRFSMELHPADLGRVEVALTIGANGAATAHLKFDTAVTAATFSAHESELRQSLTQAGVTLSDDALSFSSQDGSSSSGGSAFASQQDSQNASPFAARRMRAAADLETQSDVSSLDASLASFRNGASRLALNLIV